MKTEYYTYEDRWAHLHKRPERILCKLPMSRLVLSVYGDYYQYDFTDKGINWKYVGSSWLSKDLRDYRNKMMKNNKNLDADLAEIVEDELMNLI